MARGSTSRLLALLVAAAVCADDSFFLKAPPNKSPGPTIALVLIQGASSPPSGYRPIAEALQAASPLPVWVGVPQFLIDTPSPVQFGSKLRQTIKIMEAAGMRANRTVVFAHSLGGVFAQMHAASSSDCDALVLYGATLLRKYRDVRKQDSNPRPRFCLRSLLC